MGEPVKERSVDEAGALLRAVALYRVCVGDVVDLRAEQRALQNRLKQLPDELEQAELREAEARMTLLSAARGEHGESRVSEIEEVVNALADADRLAHAGRSR